MSLFVFNNQQKLIKSIPNRDLISVVQDQAINVSDTLFVEMPADIWSNLKEPASYLAVQDPYERFSYHMYKVSKHTTKADTVDLEAIQIGYDELKAYGYIKDRRFNNRPVLEATAAIVDGTDWQLGYVDTNLPNVNTNFYYISRLEALSKLIEATGAEVRFRIEISGNKIIAKRLDLYKQLGTFKGKRFAYGSNLLEIIKEEDTSELYTALVGRGKGEETDTGGFGRRITFADIAWSKASGKPVDKPLGQEFIELPEMTVYYGYPDGEPRTGIVEFGDIEEPEQLLKATYERLVEISRPQVQFKAKVQTTGDMQLGEEVAIIRSDLGFRYKTRVFRVKRDYLNNMFTEVELGDKLTESLASRIKKIDTTNARREETIIQYIQTAANGKNKIFRDPVEPTEGMMVNDLWYKPIGDGETEMYQWNGAMWEQLVARGMNDETVGRIEEAKEIAEGARGDAKSVQVSADSILAGLGVETIGETHAEIVDTISLNLADKAGIGYVDGTIQGLETAVDTRINNLQTDIETDLSTKADDVIIRQHIDEENGKLMTSISAIIDDPEASIVGYNVLTQTVDGNVQEIGSIKTNPNETITGYNTLTQTVDGNVSTIAAIKTTPETEIANYQRVVERADLYERVIGSSEVSVKDNVSRIVMADSIFKTEVSDLLEDTSTTVNQLSDSWALNLKNGDDVVTAINASSQGVYIAGKNIVLDGNTVVDGTFTVTDEFFAKNMNISKFTTGTLNAANVNLINVNVSTIVGNISEFIKSYWNAINGQITIDGTKFEGRDTEGNRSVINTSGQFRSESGTDGRYGIFEKGRIWFYNEDGSAVLNIGAHPVTGDAGFLKGVVATARAQRLILGRYNDYLTNNINATVNPYISFEYGSTVGDESNVYIKNWKDVSMSGKHINDVRHIEGYELAIRSSQGRLRLGAPQPDGKRYNTLEVGYANTISNGSIDMKGYNITNQSDIRLKTNIVDSEVNALHEIERMKFIEYDWDLENPANDKKPTGRQFGIVAQYSPFLQTKASGSESYLSVDMSKQVNLNSKAMQELLNRIKALEAKI